MKISKSSLIVFIIAFLIYETAKFILGLSPLALALLAFVLMWSAGYIMVKIQQKRDD